MWAAAISRRLLGARLSSVPGCVAVARVLASLYIFARVSPLASDAFRRLAPTPVGVLGRSFYGRLGPLLKSLLRPLKRPFPNPVRRAETEMEKPA